MRGVVCEPACIQVGGAAVAHPLLLRRCMPAMHVAPARMTHGLHVGLKGCRGCKPPSTSFTPLVFTQDQIAVFWHQSNWHDLQRRSCFLRCCFGARVSRFRRGLGCGRFLLFGVVLCLPLRMLVVCLNVGRRLAVWVALPGWPAESVNPSLGDPAKFDIYI